MPIDERRAPHAGRVFLALLLALSLGACSVPLSYFDSDSYRNLTELKAEAASLVETFDGSTAADRTDEIDDLQLRMRKAYEYERGKGPKNADTASQVALLRKLVDDTIEDFRTSEPGDLGPKFFSEAAKTIEQAFDTAIDTERSKNKAEG